MKKTLISIMLATSFVGVGYSQTNTPVNLWGDVSQLAKDAAHVFSNQSLSDGVSAVPFAIKHNSDWGGGLFIGTAHTNSVNVGITGLYFNHQFYDASLTIQANGTYNIPVLNYPANLWVETGPAVNLSNPNTVLEQSFSGADVSFKLGHGWELGVVGGFGHCSQFSSDIIYMGGIHITKRL